MQTRSKICKEFFTIKANNTSITTGFIKRKIAGSGSAFVKALILGNLSDGHST